MDNDIDIEHCTFLTDFRQNLNTEGDSIYVCSNYLLFYLSSESLLRSLSRLFQLCWWPSPSCHCKVLFLYLLHNSLCVLRCWYHVVTLSECLTTSQHSLQLDKSESHSSNYWEIWNEGRRREGARKYIKVVSKKPICSGQDSMKCIIG